MKSLKFEENGNNNEIAEKLNKLARLKMKQKLLADIRVDIEICKLEGWSVSEYLRDIKDLINSFKV